VRGMGAITTYIIQGLDDSGTAREFDIMDAIDQCERAGSNVISWLINDTKIQKYD
jgi:hypothetical protein